MTDFDIIDLDFLQPINYEKFRINIQRDNNNKIIGMNDIILNQPLKDSYLLDKSLMQNNKFHSWIKDCIGVSLIKNTDIIDFIEYYPTINTSIYFNNNLCLLKKELIHDIKKLLSHSYCVIYASTYYFPQINMYILTNKCLSKPGYSLGIYKYGCYDNCYKSSKYADFLLAINNKNDYKKGEIFIFDNYKLVKRSNII